MANETDVYLAAERAGPQTVSTPEGQNAGPTAIEFGGNGNFLKGSHDASDWNLHYPVNRKPESGGKNLG